MSPAARSRLQLFLPALILVASAAALYARSLVSEIAAERRMYLPLAALVAAVVLGAHALLRGRVARGVLAGLAASAALALACTSALRLELYRSPLALWSQVLDVYPTHRLRDRIESSIAQELVHEGRLSDALPHFELAAQLRPSAAENWANLGRARLMQGALEPAVTALARAVELAPDAADDHADLGLALARMSRWIEAEAELEHALVLEPTHAKARKTLARVLVHSGEALVVSGELAGAVPRFQRAVQLDPAFGAAQQDLVETLMRLQQARPSPPARESRIKPGSAAESGGTGDGDG